MNIEEVNKQRMKTRKTFALMVLFAGLLLVAVSLPLAAFGTLNNKTFEEKAVDTLVVVTEAGPNITNAGRELNQQDITVSAMDEENGLNGTYDKRVDLNNVSDSQSGIRTLIVGETLRAKVIPGDPESLRLNGETSNQAGFFWFMSAIGVIILGAGSYLTMQLKRN